MATKVAGYIGKLNPGNGTNYALGSTAYGYCQTAAGTAAKVCDMTGFTLMEGATIHVKFQYANTATSPTLNVNKTGAKPIVQYGTTAVGTASETTGWYEGAVLSLTYDGTSWVRDQGFNTNTNTDTLVSQRNTTSTLSYPVLLRSESSGTSNISGVAYFTQNVTVNPATGVLTAKHINSDVVPVYGKGVNMLDNWYFVGGGSQQGGGQFPINQWGETSYNLSSFGYTIDRWKFEPTISLTLVSGGIKITRKSYGDQRIYQYIENPTKLIGRTLTFSALIHDATYANTAVICWGQSLGAYGYAAFSGNEIVGDGLSFVTCTVPSGTEIIEVRIGANTGGEDVNFTLEAVKLELGDTQTLAHQENGAWVLNDPPPNFALELMKCQRHQEGWNKYIAILNDVQGENEYSIVNTTIPFKVTKRTKNGAIIIKSPNGTLDRVGRWTGNQWEDSQNYNVSNLDENGFRLILTNQLGDVVQFSWFYDGNLN